MEVHNQPSGEGLLLELEESAPPLQMRGELLVFCGELEGDPDRLLSEIRDERIKRHAAP